MDRNKIIEKLEYPDTDIESSIEVQQGDARNLPINDNTIDLIVTSPPYWQKRDYGHEDQIGQESTPEEYVDKLMACFGEWERVLRDTGTVFLNIGDKYKKRSRMGIPWLVAQSARECGWKIRNEIVWHKPNGVPTPARDRFTGRHETIFYLTPGNGDYYFDKYGFELIYDDPIDVWKFSHDRNGNHLAPFPEELVERCLVAGAAPAVCSCDEPRERIVEKSLTQLNPNREQSERAMEIYNKRDELGPKHIKAIQATGISDAGKGKEIQKGSGGNTKDVKQLADEAKDILGGYFREFTFPEKITAGWTECDCDTPEYKSGTVLDPFAGSGTTIDVASDMGFNVKGIDLLEEKKMQTKTS